MLWIKALTTLASIAALYRGHKHTDEELEVQSLSLPGLLVVGSVPGSGSGITISRVSCGGLGSREPPV